tara:strand:+ start:517 stop:1608 length:1092 start_codon:yes stop_codon:yes gene_type:complete
LNRKSPISFKQSIVYEIYYDGFVCTFPILPSQNTEIINKIQIGQGRTLKRLRIPKPKKIWSLMSGADSPKLSMIVPVHNRLDCTREFLDSLLQTTQAHNFELIIIDDASSDGSKEFLDQLRDNRIQLIRNKEQQGYAKSINLGVKSATGEFLVLLNNDLVFTDGWLEPMLQCYEEKLRVGTVGNIQKNIFTRSIDHAGIIFDLIGRPDHFGKNFPFLFPFDYREFPAVTAACMVIKRSLFTSLNGFDEAFLNGGEDVDLCLRLGEKGLRNLIAGKSQVWHHVSATTGRRNYDNENCRLLIARYSKRLLNRGQKDWPIQYLMRYWGKPWLYNGPKLIDAMLRILKLKSGDSKWAKEKRAQIMNT